MFFSRLKVALFFRLPPLSDRVWWEIGGRSRPNIQTIFALPRRYRHRQQQLNNNLSSIYLAMFSAINIFQREDPAARRSSKVLTPYSKRHTHTHTVVHTLAQVQPQHGRCGGGRGRLTCTTLVLPSRPNLALVDRDCRVCVCSTISVRSGFPSANFHLFPPVPLSPLRV